MLQKHLHIVLLHFLSFLAFVSHPYAKWQDLLPEVERPRSFRLACAQPILCFTVGASWGVGWELCYGCVHGMVHLICPSAAGWNPDVCQMCQVAASYWGFDCALSLTFLFIPFESEAWPSCRTTYQSQPSWPFRGEGRNLANEILAAMGFFCSLVLLHKLMPEHQGSAYWLLGCLWGVPGIVRVLCLVSLKNFLFQASSFFLWGFWFSFS